MTKQANMKEAAVATQLEPVLKEFVTPVMKAAGFRKSGKTYRLGPARGDQALVNFQSTLMDFGSTTAFYVNVAVVSRARFEFHNLDTPAGIDREPTVAWGLLRDRLWPPSDVEIRRPETSPFRSEIWGFGNDDEDRARRCGQQLAAELGETWLPWLTRMLDRPTLRQFLRDPASEVPTMTLTGPWADAFLLLDDGPSPALDQALAEMKTAGLEVADEFLPWATERAAHAADDLSPDR